GIATQYSSPRGPVSRHAPMEPRRRSTSSSGWGCPYGRFEERRLEGMTRVYEVSRHDGTRVGTDGTGKRCRRRTRGGEGRGAGRLVGARRRLHQGLYICDRNERATRDHLAVPVRGVLPRALLSVVVDSD